MSEFSENAMKYVPINEAHAIVEAIIYVQFSPTFSDELVKCIIDAQNALDELPKKEPVTSFIAQLIPDEQGHQFNVQTPRTVGRESKKFGADGSLQWMVRAQDNVIACHCLDYERWDDFYKTSRAFLDKQFTSILHADPIVVSVGLRFIDKFLFNADLSEYSHTGLFQDNNPFLAAQVTKSGDRWHCHSGWFEDTGAPDFELLHQLNIDAARGQVDKRSSHTTIITHNCVQRAKELHSKNQVRLSSIFNNAEEDGLKVVWQLLHKKNKTLLSQLLCEKMKKRINLKLEEA